MKPESEVSGHKSTCVQVALFPLNFAGDSIVRSGRAGDEDGDSDGEARVGFWWHVETSEVSVKVGLAVPTAS